MKTYILLAIFSACHFISLGQYTIYDSWNFENQDIGSYTASKIQNDFDVVTNYHHNSGSIAVDTINGIATKVLKVTHEANKTSVGFDLDARLSQDFDEVYLSYNFKFSEEFNSTKGGKLPGLGGLPVVTANNCPNVDQGFLCKSLHKRAGKTITYHYDRTPPSYPQWCPWSTSNYKFNPIYFNNGCWYNLTRRVVMNTFTNGEPNKDGIHEFWVDGKMIYQETGLVFMEIEDENMKIDDLNIASFYGGSDRASEPRQECYTYVDNIKVYMPDNDSVIGHELHHPSTILPTPDVITDKTVYYDSLITTDGNLSNTEYGNQYSLCKDETYLVDAGEGNTVKFTWDHSLSWGDYLFFYDGNTTDSRLLRVVEEVSSQTGQEVSSTGRYLFIRFSTDTEDNSTGWTGTISLMNTTGIQGIETGDGPLNTIRVLPNPGINQLTIKGIKSNAKLTVFDMLGRKVIEKKAVKNNSQLDISQLSKGIYTMMLKDEHKHVLKFIKN